MASGSGDGKTPDLPRGLIDRRGAPAGKARLTSLRSPRDLTLGGIPKRVFVPNIPVRKERAAAAESEQAEEKKRDKSKERSERGRGRGRDGRGRGRGRGDGNLVQIQSVFEQGPAMQKIKSQESSGMIRGWGGGRGGGGGGRGGGRSGGGGGGGGHVKAFKPDPLDDDAKKKIIELLMRDDFIDEPEEEDGNLTPMFLPKIKPTSVKTQVKKEDGEPQSSSIKQEPEEDIEMSDPGKQTVESPPNNQPTEDLQSRNRTCAERLMEMSKSGKEHLALFQLPNVLPGFPATREEECASVATTSKEQKNDKEEEDKPPQTSVRCFPEGYLGKLRVRKSGKVELVLGDHVLDVSMGMPASYLQEVVSIRTDEGDRRMTMLGHVQHKMIATPNFQLLHQAMMNEDT